MSRNLTATIKTRFGKTREIKMEIGGKQGSRLTGRMFGKMMDLLSEEAETTEGFHITNKFKIAFLLWVDDVVSCVEGTENQETILKKINEFAIKHKISWGQDKCSIMRIGKHTEKTNTWKIGSMPIHETSMYKYLGDVITNDGKNTENISSRKNKLQITTIHTI